MSIAQRIVGVAGAGLTLSATVIAIWPAHTVQPADVLWLAIGGIQLQIAAIVSVVGKRKGGTAG